MEKFYLLIAGSRGYNNKDEMFKVTDAMLRDVVKDHEIVIVSGGAKGADALAEIYAKERNYEIKVIKPEWNKYGKSAGFVRNHTMHKYMVSESDKRGCLCFWDGKSTGTKHNFDLCKVQYNTQLRVYNYEIGMFINI